MHPDPGFCCARKSIAQIWGDRVVAANAAEAHRRPALLYIGRIKRQWKRWKDNKTSFHPSEWLGAAVYEVFRYIRVQGINPKNHARKHEYNKTRQYRHGRKEMLGGDWHEQSDFRRQPRQRRRNADDQQRCEKHARCSVAVQRIRSNKDGQREADFFPVVAWGKTAELCVRFLSKGRKVAIDGRLETRSYNAQDGCKRHVTEIIAEQVEFLPSAQGRGEKESEHSTANADGFEDCDDELPF